jgi:hypothetical protein
MAAFQKELGPSNTQQQKPYNRGKTGPGHKAKNRPAPATPLSAANNTPQGQIRQTSHLTQMTNNGGRHIQSSPLLPAPTHLATSIPDPATQRALQDQYLQQQQAYQLQQQQQHQQFLLQLQQRMQFEQQQQYQQQQEIQQQLLQQHHPAPLHPLQQPAPYVPQPGTDAVTYDNQWPPLPTVTVMLSGSANTFLPPMNSHSQQAYGRSPTFQGQGAVGATAIATANTLNQGTAPSSSGRSAIDRNG